MVWDGFGAQVLLIGGLNPGPGLDRNWLVLGGWGGWVLTCEWGLEANAMAHANAFVIRWILNEELRGYADVVGLRVNQKSHTPCRPR